MMSDESRRGVSELSETNDPPPRGAAAPGGGTVLFVDDDQNLLDGLRRSLHAEAYKIRTALSADEAMAILKSEPINLVVSDQGMPGTGGIGLLRMIRRAYPETIRFMLTGQATLEVAIKAINDGMVSKFFTKPCETRELIICIRQSLREQATRQEELARQSDLAAPSVGAVAAAPPDQLRHAERRRIEWENPGITRVKRDETGMVILGEIHRPFDEFIDTIRTIGAEDDLDL